MDFLMPFVSISSSFSFLHGGHICVFLKLATDANLAYLS